MTQRDMRDVIGGLAMMVLGAFAAWFAYGNYEIGTLNRMGPGFFPVVLGLLLIFFGLLIALPALFREGESITVQWKTLLTVTASVVVFGLLLKTMGLVLATVAGVLLSSLADRDITWRSRILVALGIALITWLVFSLGLGMILPTWPWSF